MADYSLPVYLNIEKGEINRHLDLELKLLTEIEAAIGLVLPGAGTKIRTSVDTVQSMLCLEELQARVVKSRQELAKGIGEYWVEVSKAEAPDALLDSHGAEILAKFAALRIQGVRVRQLLSRLSRIASDTSQIYQHCVLQALGNQAGSRYCADGRPSHVASFLQRSST